jgi:rRNA-processing protein FCF1
MCVVVDANAAHQVHAQDAAGALVLDWLLRRRGKLVVSKSLMRELIKTQLRKVLLTLDQAGKLVRANDTVCDAFCEQIQAEGFATSNDVHILSLVVVTSCEVVFTHDQLLHKDLKNRAIVPHHCSIYQTAQHRPLLGSCRC